MPRAFVLMAAMPPTLGHLRLIEFSAELAKTYVIVCTQPGEPYRVERYMALKNSVPQGVVVAWLDRTLEQNPEAPGFWDMWLGLMTQYGFQKGDYIVASEPYGQHLAEAIGGVFVPYDLHRSITPVRATDVRNHPWASWNLVIPEFRKFVKQTVTIFGADSCGKTTLTKELAGAYDCQWLFEWARPYLENLDDVSITDDKMHMIWKGQMALQRSGNNLLDGPILFQDTDLFSTLGYWEMWEGGAPAGLREDAQNYKSDLYIIAPSNIPYEPDQLRYGVTERETTDQYWIDLCEREGLNYVVLTSQGELDRLLEASKHVNDLWARNVKLDFERSYNG